MATNRDGTWNVELTDLFGAMLADQSPVVFLVRQEMKRGKSCAKAIDFVCGEGSFAQIASEIWTSCRSKSA